MYSKSVVIFIAILASFFIYNGGGHSFSQTSRDLDSASSNIHKNATSSNGTDVKLQQERDEEVCYHRTHNVNMCIKYKALNEAEMRFAKAAVSSGISKFKMEFGISKSNNVEYKCELNKTLKFSLIDRRWLACGKTEVYSTGNPSIWFCNIATLLTDCRSRQKPSNSSESEFSNNTIIHEITHVLVFYRTEGKYLHSMFEEGIPEYISLNLPGILQNIRYSYKLLIVDYPNITASDLFNGTGIVQTNRYYNIIGPVFIKYIHELSCSGPPNSQQSSLIPDQNRNLINNYLECVRTSNQNCVGIEILSVLNDSRLDAFRNWLSLEHTKINKQITTKGQQTIPTTKTTTTILSTKATETLVPNPTSLITSDEAKATTETNYIFVGSKNRVSAENNDAADISQKNNRITLLHCIMSQQKCTVFHSNTSSSSSTYCDENAIMCNQFDAADSNPRTSAFNLITIFHDDNHYLEQACSVNYFNCSGYWQTWLENETTRNSEIDIEIASNHIPRGCQTFIAATLPPVDYPNSMEVE